LDVEVRYFPQSPDKIEKRVANEGAYFFDSVLGFVTLSAAVQSMTRDFVARLDLYPSRFATPLNSEA